MEKKINLIPDPENWRQWETLIRNVDFLEFAIKLRHFGFPSPLLDWTRSPYIAAYFAYYNATSSTNIAVYAYMERTNKGKSWGRNASRIQSVGPFIFTHQRHHIQQAEYTVCTKLASDGREAFVNHEEVTSLNDQRQDVLVKFVLPGRERNSVIKLLDQMNINSYTLFRDEAGLCRYLAEKYISSSNN